MISAQQLEFVHNEQLDILNIPPLLPPPGQHVPLLRGRDDDVPLGQQLQVRPGLPGEDDHLEPQAGEPVVPVGVGVVREGVHGRHVDTPTLGVGGEQAEDRHLRTHGLTTAGGGSDEDIVIRVVQSIENLELPIFHLYLISDCPL